MKTYNRLLLLSVTVLITALTLSIANGQTSTKKYTWENLPKATMPVFRKDTLNIIRYGAVPDGQTLNTNSINNAIKDCSKKGGGVVLVPGGLWLTGPVEMQNNVNLHISRSAILLFTSDFDQYSLVEGNYEGKPSMRNQSPLSGVDLQNIAVTGTGVIDGNGDHWRMITRDRLTEKEWKEKVASGGLLSEDGKTWFPSVKTKRGYQTKDPGAILPSKKAADYEDVKDYLRPTLLNFTGCKKVLLEGVTFQNSPAWGLHLLLCEDLTIKNVYVKNPDYAQNGDGLDLESSRNVLIDGCTFDVGDDGICIKSGKDEEGRKRGTPTENVVIKNSFVYKGHGGFVIGSEMSGGARNIFISNCSFMGTDKGLRFKTARGRGGVVENIYVKNIYMKDIVDEAIYFDMYYFTKPPAIGEKVDVPVISDKTPQFRNFDIQNVVCNGAGKAIFMRGLPEMNVKNVNIRNVELTANMGIEIIEAENITLSSLKIVTTQADAVMYVESSKSIKIDKLSYPENSKLLCKIIGERSKDIVLRNIGTNKVELITENGAKESSVSLK